MVLMLPCPELQDRSITRSSDWSDTENLVNAHVLHRDTLVVLAYV